MRNILRAVFLFACAAMLASGSVAFAKDHWIGTWTLNAAASKFSPGPAPKSQTLKFESTKDGIKLTSHIVDADGKERTGEYLSQFDGADVPWKGNPDADTASAKRIDANSYENAWKKDGKVVVNAKVVVSADGKTLTIMQKGTDAKGAAVDNTIVLDRK